MSPKRLVYVSCDPATLARDVALLKERGFRVEKVTAADLFPRCSHIESIVLLSKLADDHIELEIDPLELEKVVDRVPPSYPEIKQYILDKYKIKVPSLYIAQVKRKLRLNLRECYNKPWSAKAAQHRKLAQKKKLLLWMLCDISM